MNNLIDQSKLIDSRNEDLFEMVSSKFDVTFEPSFNDEHSVYTIENQMTFYIPTGVYCVDSFSHELLHGYMEYCGVNITGNFKNTMWQSNILQRIFDNNLAEHITKSISHKLMLPVFLERGFDRTKFLFDYHTFKAEPGFIGRIGKIYKQGGQHDSSAVKNFAGKYFAFKCDPNPDFDYQNELIQLRKIDPQLYRIIDEYFSQWSNYDFTNDEFSEFRTINSDLYISLKPWMSGKKFV